MSLSGLFPKLQFWSAKRNQHLQGTVYLSLLMTSRLNCIFKCLCLSLDKIRWEWRHQTSTVHTL